MPTPDRTSLDDIVRAGRDILESDGPSRLSMQAVADRVGVRAPSLYKRVPSRDDLIRLVAEATLTELGERLAAVARPGGDPLPRLGDLARALRAFAHERPAGYRLVFTLTSDATAPSAESLERSSAALFAVAAELAGPRDALEAARTVTAWAHGFIGMELAGAFRLGGDIETAYEYGIRRLAVALAG